MLARVLLLLLLTKVLRYILLAPVVVVEVEVDSRLALDFRLPIS